MFRKCFGDQRYFSGLLRPNNSERDFRPRQKHKIPENTPENIRGVNPSVKPRDVAQLQQFVVPYCGWPGLALSVFIGESPVTTPSTSPTILLDPSGNDDHKPSVITPRAREHRSSGLRPVVRRILRIVFIIRVMLNLNSTSSFNFKLPPPLTLSQSSAAADGTRHTTSLPSAGWVTAYDQPAEGKVYIGFVSGFARSRCRDVFPAS
jgi:hypothetical protein